MQLNNTAPVKEVNLLDKKKIQHDERAYTLIYNNQTGMHVVQFPATIPVKVDSLHTYTIDDDVAPKLKQYPKINSIKSIGVLMKSAVSNLMNTVMPVESFDGLVFDLREVSPNNIAHLMMDIIPLCLHVKSLTDKKVHVLTDKLKLPFQQLLAIFDIHPVITNRKIQGKFVRTSLMKGFSTYGCFDMLETSAISYLPDIFDAYHFECKLDNLEKIFIARRGERGLKNLSDVEAILKEQGYKTIYMEDYSLEEQLGIASNAKDVVAVHGASMGMLALKSDINSLIEIMPVNAYQEHFTIALNGKVKQHIQIMPYHDDSVAYNDWETILSFKSSVFAVDLEQLKKALEMLT